jgi:Uma2 family endonuclease
MTMTGAQFDALPFEEGRRWELMNGELVPIPSATWRHQKIAFETKLAFEQYLKAGRVNGVAAQGVEFALSDDDRVRPDVCVLLGEKANRLDRDKIPIPGAPDLAVEIISPSESAAQSLDKVRLYLQHGTAEVWQVYPKSRSVQIHRGDTATFVGPEGLLTSELLPGLSIPSRPFSSNYTLQIA